MAGFISRRLSGEASEGHYGISAQSWWGANRTKFSDPARIDSTMSELKILAAERRAPLAARAALVASIAALDECPEPPIDAVMLMRLDLTGMAGWLRAHGVDAPFPRNVEHAAEALCERLRSRGHVTLADKLTKEVAATLAIPVHFNGDVHAANALMQLVDEAEQAVR